MMRPRLRCLHRLDIRQRSSQRAALQLEWHVFLDLRGPVVRASVTVKANGKAVFASTDLGKAWRVRGDTDAYQLAGLIGVQRLLE